MKPLFLFSLVAVLLLPWHANAAKVKTWHHHRPADLERAERKSVVQTESGAWKLSQRLKPLAKLDCTHVWAVVENRAGSLFVATGDEGKVFEITPAGKVSVAYEGDAAQVLSLTTDAKGEVVYAGTGPTGRIVRIDSKGAKVLCELKESYVWALAVDPKSETIYAATGPNGRICKVTPDGKSSVFFETKQDHVLSLALAGDGNLYAGTDKTGRVYRIDVRGKGFVVHQTAQSEVRTLLWTDDALFVGTASTKKRTSSVSGSSRTMASKRIEKEAPVRVSTTEQTEKTNTTEKKKDEPSKDKKEGSPAAASSTPGAGENSVYRIARDGGVREVFRDKVLVLSLAKVGRRIIAGTGMAGQLFEIDSGGEQCEIARLDHGQVTSLLARKDGSLVVGTGDPGTVYVLENRHQAKGSITSEVLDAKLVAKWGALRWRGETPDKTTITVAVRSGNVAEPDDTWSDWSVEQTDGDESVIPAPAARYLQYRVTLATEDPAGTPTLKSLTIRYATTNQAPQMKKVEVPDLSSATLENPKKLKFRWSATDENEDELRYRLYVKKDGWENWVELEDDLEKTDYEWDTTTTPSGVYRLKVVASDHTDNPAKEALSAEKVSEPFVVCHTPPTVTVKTTGDVDGKVIVEATASSTLVRLTSASFAVNGKKWKNVFPGDGLFDDKKESFSFSTAKLKPGTYVLVLKVQDAAGNTGSGDVVFTVPARPVARK